MLSIQGKRLIKAAAISMALVTVAWGAKSPEPAAGWQAFQEKRYADALREAEMELSKEPNDQDAHWLAAEVTLAQADTVASLNHWQAVLAENPAHPPAVMNEVEIFLARSDTNSARTVIETALTRTKKPDQAEYYYAKGLLADARGQDSEAMVSLSQAIEKNSKERRFYVALGRVYEKKKILSLAKDNYCKAIALDSTVASLHFDLANVYLDLKEYNDALAELKTTRELDPEYPNVSYQIGKLYFYAGKYEQAAVELEAAIKNNREISFFLSSIYGQTLRSLKRLDEAQEHLDKASSLKPADISTTRALAQNSFDLKKYEQAIEVTRRLLTASEAEPNDYTRLGESFYNLAGKDSLTVTYYDSAIVYLKQGLNLNPDNSRLAYMIGMAYFSTDVYDSALVYLGRRAAADSSSFQVFYFLGYSYLKKTMYQEAIKNLRLANQIDSTRVSVHMMLAQTLPYVDSTSAAKQEYRKVIELDPQQGDAYGGLGTIYLTEASKLPEDTEREVSKEYWGRAANTLRQATALRPENLAYWVGYGQASYYSRNYDEAERAFNRVLRLDPRNEAAQSGLEAIQKVKSRRK